MDFCNILPKVFCIIVAEGLCTSRLRGGAAFAPKLSVPIIQRSFFNIAE